MQAAHQEHEGEDPGRFGSGTAEAGTDREGGDPSARNDASSSSSPSGSTPAAQGTGYGRPPAEHRFRPGRSGNPKGRPRGDTSFRRLLERELAEPVPVKEGGRRRTLSRRSVIVKRLVSEAMAGNPKHLAIVLAQDPASVDVLDEVAAALSRPADDLVKQGLIRRLREAAEPDASPDPVAADGPGMSQAPALFEAGDAEAALGHAMTGSPAAPAGPGTAAPHADVALGLGRDALR